MLNLIRNILSQIIDNIDSGSSNISESEQQQVLDILNQMNRQELSKTESAEYIGVCRATFDNYIQKGLIPKGHKRQGFKELSWFKSDLDKYVKNV